MEIRLSINDSFIEKLKEDTGIDKVSQLTTEALSLLKWAVAEAKKGRVLATSDDDGENVRRVVMPSLEHALAQSGVLEDA